MTQEKKNYALPIAMMFALFAMIAFVTGFTNPLGVIAKIEFGGLFQGNENLISQLGTAANFLAYALMGIPAGLMIKKIGYRKTAIVAVVVGFFGVGLQFVSGNMSYGAMGTFVIDNTGSREDLERALDEWLSARGLGEGASTPRPGEVE